MGLDLLVGVGAAWLVAVGLVVEAELIRQPRGRELGLAVGQTEVLEDFSHHGNLGDAGDDRERVAALGAVERIGESVGKGRSLQAKLDRLRLVVGQRVVELGLEVIVATVRRTLEQAADATDHGAELALELLLGRWWQLHEGGRLLGLESERTVGHQAMAVWIRVEGRARLVQEGDCSDMRSAHFIQGAEWRSFLNESSTFYERVDVYYLTPPLPDG